MTKTKLAASFAIVLLLVSVGVNLYQYTLYTSLDTQKTAAQTKLQMQDILLEVQSQVNLELSKLDQALLVACSRLSSTDLRGEQARKILLDLANNSSLIVNACTSDENDVILAIEPSQYSSIEGADIAGQEQNLMMHETMRPVMSTMILLVEGFYGVVLVAPIFNPNNTFIGSLSLVIQPYNLLKATISPSIEETPFAMWTMQTNGTLLYDPDPVQQGKNLFTDPIYVNYPTLQTFVHQAADSPDGYGAYDYHQDTTEGKLVSKEAYWTTAGIYGTQWRIIILNVLNQ